MSWDKKKFNTLRSILRRGWMRYASRLEALRVAKRPYVGENKRRRFEYRCAICESHFIQADVQVDHKKPCGQLLKKEDIAEFVINLFCDVDDLQVVCRPCHQQKTNKERAEAKKK